MPNRIIIQMNCLINQRYYLCSCTNCQTDQPIVGLQSTLLVIGNAMRVVVSMYVCMSCYCERNLIGRT